jgi:hypothetical protein
MAFGHMGYRLRTRSGRNRRWNGQWIALSHVAHRGDLLQLSERNRPYSRALQCSSRIAGQAVHGFATPPNDASIDSGHQADNKTVARTRHFAARRQASVVTANTRYPTSRSRHRRWHAEHRRYT